MIYKVSTEESFFEKVAASTMHMSYMRAIDIYIETAKNFLMSLLLKK